MYINIYIYYLSFSFIFGYLIFFFFFNKTHLLYTHTTYDVEMKYQRVRQQDEILLRRNNAL